MIPVVVDGGEVEIRGGAEQQQVLKCKGLPPHVSIPALMGRGKKMDVFRVVVDGRELRVGGGAEQQ